MTEKITLLTKLVDLVDFVFRAEGKADTTVIVSNPILSNVGNEHVEEVITPHKRKKRGEETDEERKARKREYQRKWFEKHRAQKSKKSEVISRIVQRAATNAASNETRYHCNACGMFFFSEKNLLDVECTSCFNKVDVVKA